MLSKRVKKAADGVVVYLLLGIMICLSLPLVAFYYLRYGLADNSEPSFDNYTPLQWR